MAASKSQGRSFTLFMVGVTAAAAGIAYISSGGGKVALVLGLIILIASFAGFLKIRPLEGKTADGAQSALHKLAGIVVTLAGWMVVLLGLHLTASVSGRLTTTILGLAISLVGVLCILPAATNKHAIWKA
jgi:uncharacterized membrane protein